MKIRTNKDKYIIIGVAAGAALLTFYFIVASLFGGAEFAIDNFVTLWYWMVPLSVGFGIQMGMFFYMRDMIHKAAAASAAVSTGTSATSMIACCAHHLSDVAPFLGIAALGIFFTKYQTVFLLIGIVSNILGIFYMKSMMSPKIRKQGPKKIFYILLIASILVIAASFYYVSRQNTPSALSKQFQAQISNQNNVEFTVKPLSPSEFQITINTHSVDLGFELAEIGILYDDKGNAYKAVSWEGSPPGGHHREGILKFPSIYIDAKSIKLVISDHNNKREFNWGLQ